MPAARVSPSTTALKNKPETNRSTIERQLAQQSIDSSNDNSGNSTTDITGSDNSLLRCNSNSNDMKLTPYRRILYCLDSDERWQREIALGRRIGFYRFRGDIGNGNFSQVKVAVHGLTKEKVAVKILDKCKLDPKTYRMLLREIRSMEDLHHPNLIRLFEVIETLSKIFLVMEYAPNGELFQIITRDGRLEEKDAKPLFAQIVAAIDHMHSHNIIHRDIKAENVFYVDSKTVKVGDFGFSIQIRNKEELLNTFCGSPPYAAPELFHDDSYLGPYVDFWALGVLLYFMTTATMPFKSQTISALKKVISGGIYEIPDYLSQECRNVIEGLLQQKPSQRLNLNDLRLTEWLRGQNFPNSLPKYELRIYDFNSKEQNNNKVCMSSDEKEAYKQLKDLGISDALIYDSLEKGSRSNVTGIFRIIMHRIINSGYQKNNSTKKAENINHTPNDSNININTNDSISNKSDTKHTKSSKSMSKSIKSLKNIFIDKPSTNTLSKIDDRLNANGNNSRPMKKRRKSRACCIL